MSVTLSNITPARILIIRLGAVRDGLMTVPLAVDAKRLWPDSHLCWIVDGEVEEILQEHSSIDQVIRIERKWIKQPRTWRNLKQQLHEQNFDLVLDPQSVFKSAFLGTFSRCKVRLGFDRPQARELASYFLTHKLRPNFRHRVDIYRELLKPWRETVAGQAEFQLPSDTATEHHVRQAIQSVLQRGSNWIAIYPGAIWPTAIWPLDRFTAIARHLHDTYQMKSVVLWRNEHEKLVAKVIAEQAHSAAVLSPELDLREMVEACRQATFVVTGDSDILQIVSSVGTPSISLHGPTWADEFGGYHYGNYAIQSPFPLVGRRRFRKGANSAMLAIEYDEVQSYAERLIRDLELKKRAAA